jgi:hypothetical protein
MILKNANRWGFGERDMQKITNFLNKKFIEPLPVISNEQIEICSGRILPGKGFDIESDVTSSEIRQNFKILCLLKILQLGWNLYGYS